MIAKENKAESIQFKHYFYAKVCAKTRIVKYGHRLQLDIYALGHSTHVWQMMLKWISCSFIHVHVTTAKYSKVENN